MKHFYILFILLVSFLSTNAQTVFWSETFDPTPALGWTINTQYGGVNGPQANFWEINDNEGGVAPGLCGVANNSDQTLHVFNILNLGSGATYFTGFLGPCPGPLCGETYMLCSTPTISTVGKTNITFNFDYIENGDANLDNFSLYYSTNNGTTWTLLDDPAKTPLGACAPQATWANYSIALPAACENISSLKLGFYWTNNNDGLGTDPSVAINNIQLTVPTVVNNPPVALDNSYTPPCSSLNFALNVLVNDSDPDVNDTITIAQIVDAPDHGSASIFGNFILYSPTTCYFGPDTIMYSIQDNFTPPSYDTAYVYLNVLNNCGCNTPPVALPDYDSVSCSAIVALHPIANDFDPNFGSVLSLGPILSGPFHGSINISGNDINYTPNTCYVGNDTIRYTVCDNGSPSLCSDTFIYVKVVDCGCNDAPIAAFDFENTNCNTAMVLQPLLNDTEINAGQILSLSAVASAPKHGTFSISGNTINYVPANCFSGNDTLSYVVCDDHPTNSKCDTAFVYITVGICACNPPIANFTASKTIICQNDCIDFSDLSLNTPTSYSWVFTGSATPTSNQANPQNICYFTPGLYPVTLTATNQYGSDAETKIDFIEVRPLPTITMSNDTTVVQGNQVLLIATGGIDYEWLPSFGLSNPNAGVTMYSGIATNTFTCNVTGANGCVGQDSVTITVKADTSIVKTGFFLEFPNAISPNHDGRNDDFLAVHNGLVYFELHIFNRYGNEVFRSYDPDFRWNGSDKGSSSSANEVFVYYCRAKYKNGQEINLKGDVTVVY